MGGGSPPLPPNPRIQTNRQSTALGQNRTRIAEYLSVNDKPRASTSTTSPMPFCPSCPSLLILHCMYATWLFDRVVFFSDSEPLLYILLGVIRLARRRKSVSLDDANVSSGEYIRTISDTNSGKDGRGRGGRGGGGGCTQRYIDTARLNFHSNGQVRQS